MRLLAAVVAVACSACGGHVSNDATEHDSDAAPFGTLELPLGSYTGCTSTAVTLAPNFEGTAGGDGSITLAQAGDRVVATLAFDPFVVGKLAFTPASATSASFDAGQAHDLETMAYEGALPTGSMVALTAVTGSLALVGDTLFIAAHGKTDSSEVSTFLRCPVPASLPPTSLLTNASASPAVTTGAFGPCTSSIGSKSGGYLSGGNGSVTVAKVGGTFSATWASDVTPICKSLDFSGSNAAPALAAGQSCDLHDPCGPPPTLGQSPYPLDAVLTGMTGAMRTNGQSLFIDVVAETTPETCGRHYFSLICASAQN